MMKSWLLRGCGWLGLAMGLLPLIAWTRPIDREVSVGGIVLPQAVQLGKTVLKPGRYEVRLVPKTEGVFFQFYQHGQLVAEDLAIEQTSPRPSRTPVVHVAKVPNQEFTRILVHYGTSVYKLFLPPATE